MKFLLGLNDYYATIRGQILLYEPLPNINKVLSLVLQEEKQRSLKNGSATNSVMGHPIEATTLYSNANSNAKVNHGGRGNSKKDGPICSHCEKIGHIADKCYRLHGFPLGFKFKGNLQPIRFLGNQVMNCCLIFLGIFCFIQDLAHWSTIGLRRKQN